MNTPLTYVFLLLATFGGASAEDLNLKVLGDAKADANYSVSRVGEQIQIERRMDHKVIWAKTLSPTGKERRWELSLNPSEQSALLDFGYGTKGQSLYALDLRNDTANAPHLINADDLNGVVAQAIGAPSFYHVQASFQNWGWLSDSVGLLIWTADYGEDERSLHAGIVIVRFRDGGVPLIEAGPCQTSMNIDRMSELYESGYKALLQKCQQVR